MAQRSAYRELWLTQWSNVTNKMGIRWEMSILYNFIKTTYDISLNSQIYLLPLGFSPQYVVISLGPSVGTCVPQTMTHITVWENHMRESCDGRANTYFFEKNRWPVPSTDSLYNMWLLFPDKDRQLQLEPTVCAAVHVRMKSHSHTNWGKMV